jgi:alkylation response protein AidB-like acyl-CoA dehydrogenase
MAFFSKEIIASIREQSLSSESHSAISSEALSVIYRHRLFKLFVPGELNGAAESLPAAIRIFEEASHIDGSFGWLITIGSGGGYFASIFAPEVAAELFTPDDAVVAGSGHPIGTVHNVPGGYRATGSWRYCSGADFATIFTANCVLPDGTVRSFIFSPDQVQVTRDWDAYGLKATSSHTISVSDAFVPEGRTFDIANGKRYYEHPIYDYPFIPFAEASFAAVNIGICRHFFEEAESVLKLYQSAGNEQRYNFVHDLILRQRSLLNQAVEVFYLAVERSWTALLNDKKMEDQMLNEVSHTAKKSVSVALSAAQAVYPYLGLSVAMEHTALNRCWRDLHTASQHILLKSFE